MNLQTKLCTTKIIPALILIVGIGAACVGIFDESTGVVHFIFSMIAFLFSVILAIVSSK